MAKGKPVEVKYETLVMVWFALLISQVLFLVVVYVVEPQLFTLDLTRPLFEDSPLVTFVFAVIAIVFFVLSFVLSRQHMRRAVRDKDAGCVQTGLVLGCALAEIPSILGLVLAFGFAHPYFYLWIALGIIGVLAHFPRRGNLVAANAADL
jgi:hypothetical protein